MAANSGRGRSDLIAKTAIVTLSVAGVLCGFYIIYELHSLISMMLFASIIAYALSPIVGRMEDAGINRTLGIIVITTLITGGIVALLLFVIPTILREIAEFFQGFPTYFEQGRALLISLWERFFGESFPSNVQSFLDTIAPSSATLKSIASKAIKPLGTLLAGAFTGVVGFIVWIVGLAIAPVVIFYLLRDFERIVDGAVALIPVSRKDAVVSLFREINETLGNLIRGQLLVALMLSVLYSIGLYAIGVRYAVLLGFISGFANIIPYFSLVVGFFVAIGAAIHFASWVEPLYVVMLFAVVQTLEGFVLTPKIVGKKVGLHPLLIILALLVGASLGGIVGVLLAVPTAAVLKVVVTHFHRKLKGRTEQEEAEPAMPIESEPAQDQDLDASEHVDAETSPALEAQKEGEEVQQDDEQQDEDPCQSS